MTPLHPATRLACWMLLVLTIQCLSGLALVMAFAVLPLLGGAVLRHGGRLLWRMRWLLLSLFLILGWGVAGEPLYENGGLLVPTQEGAAEALTQTGRLALVLMALAWLIERTPTAALMAGCHALLRPLRGFGLDVERAVARLMLTLHYAETLPPVRGWRELLTRGANTPGGAMPVVRIAGATAGFGDVVALSVSVSLLAGVLAA